MKKLLFLLLCSATALAATAETRMVRQTRFEGKNITGVSASSSFKVEIYQSENTSASIEVPAELEDKIIFSISNDGVVTLGMESPRKGIISWGNLGSGNYDLTAKIYLKSLKHLKASASARIRAMTPLTGSDIQIGISSSARIEELVLTATGRVGIDLSSSARLLSTTISAPELQCGLSSSSKAVLTHTGESASFTQSSSSRVEISGNVQAATIRTSSSSAFQGGGYNIGNATLVSSSSSKIIVGKIERLNAQVSSSSAIRYKGDPKVTNIKTSSSASIRKSE